MSPIEFIRARIESGEFSFVSHALVEAAEDNLSGDDVLRALRTGRIIESYPERNRLLILGRAVNQRPVHVVIELIEDSFDIFTCYVPDSTTWTKSFKKRRKT